MRHRPCPVRLPPPAASGTNGAIGDRTGTAARLRRRAEHRRYPAPIEAAVYFTVAEAISDAARRSADHVAVSVTREGRRLVVMVEDNGSGDALPMLAAADRIGALGGSLAPGPAMCRAEIPCAS